MGRLWKNRRDGKPVPYKSIGCPQSVGVDDHIDPPIKENVGKYAQRFGKIGRGG
jgi:hypothetical protein